jgi:aminopeptidase N
MRAVVLLFAALLLTSVPPEIRSTQDAAAPAPEPGVSRALAEERAGRVADLRYSLDLVLPAEPQRPIDGRATIRFSLSGAARPLALDFAVPADRIRSLRVNGAALEPAASNGHVMLPAAALRAGANEIAIAFEAGDAPLNRSADFLYSLFVPGRAHEAIPCFDQPDLKGRWTVTLTVPSEWAALSNGAETERQTVANGVRVSFAETRPIPTYLLAFAAGRFSIETAERDGRTFRMFHRETDASRVARNRDRVFDLHAAALEWLERYTGIPYPWDSFDFLLVPSFQFGGMEHPGAIYYNASGILLDPSATQNQELARASVIAHETAHMWFGDLVTMRWFDDVWMKEVFANFMAAKIVNPSFPGINHDLRFLYAHYPAAYDVDRTAGTNAIRQPLDNLSDAGTLYGAIVYQKAPIVMRQLERITGEEAFRDGLREYLTGHAFGNASWQDLVSLLDARTPMGLNEWSHAWVAEAGRPIVTTSLTVADGRIASLAFDQRDPIPARGLTWDQEIQVLVAASSGQPRTLTVRLHGARTPVPDATGLPAPLFVLPSGGGIGYADFALDEGSRRYLLDHLPDVADPLTRGAAWMTLWDQMLDGRAPASALLDLALRVVQAESDEQTVQRVLDDATRLYWIFVEPAERERVTPRLERTLRAGLDRASSASLKSAWFTALRNVARSPDVLAWLERVWNRQETVPGLPLAEPDEIALAMELAVRGGPRAEDIFDRQIARTMNPDRKARLAFVRPALSADDAVRDRFFASLADPANRRHEPWVLEAVSYLHHPLRAGSAEKYIPASLTLLREIQRTGDIFFPKRWMDATLGGHRSAAAAGAVRAFVDALPPGYPDRLRRVILSSADDLFRVAGR